MAAIRRHLLRELAVQVADFPHAVHVPCVLRTVSVLGLGRDAVFVFGTAACDVVEGLDFGA